MAINYSAGNAEVDSRGPCSKCGSKDNLVKYKDGHSTCYSVGCGHFIKSGESMHNQSTVVPTPPRKEVNKEDLIKGTKGSIPDRRLSQDILDKFGVTIEYDAKGDITKHHYPYYNSDNKIVALKTRVTKYKQFFCSGNLGDAGLFGQNVFEGRAGGRYITVTEGELDALAVSSMFHGKWPVVSLKNGSGSAVKGIKESLEFLESFDSVILCMDQDDAGSDATKNIVDLFSPNKVKVMQMPLKDASEMLMKGKVKEFTECWWSAKPHRPAGVVSLSDAGNWDLFVKRGTEEVTPLPKAFGSLNAMMNGGIAAGEITVLGALTSIGKSTVVYNLVYDMLMESNKRIGCIFLEADVGETIEKLISVHIGQNISNVPQPERDYDQLHKKYSELADTDKLHILDHQGALEADELFSKMRYMVKGLDCDVLILDPLQAAVTSNENGTVDAFMDKCLKLAKETGVSIIVVSHMRKPSAKDAHDVNEYDMKGSGSINQIAFNTILLSRDKLSEDEYARNCTKIQLVKCRRTGNTGVGGWLFYNSDTSRLEAGQAPIIQETSNYDF
jgi:twinkle protein|tara:strand:+ start:2511 stop:4181 length:1671 start_codon:yes stop_codon:yes gene_type:complete